LGKLVLQIVKKMKKLLLETLQFKIELGLNGITASTNAAQSL
jgi:hypothetical protein